MKKFKKIFNTRIVKFKKSYSTQEIADLFGVHVSTVHSWYRSGLKKIDNKRPALVFGLDIIAFLNKKNKQNKKKCNSDELFCCKCKVPHKSKENKVYVRIMNEKKIMLIGSCEKCGTKMNKSGSFLKIEEYKKIFDVQEIEKGRLLGCTHTCVSASKKLKGKHG